MVEYNGELGELPYVDLVVDDGTLRSIFDFKGGNEELFPFLVDAR